MVIGSRKIDNSEPPLVIAELGINHEGNIDKAIKMIDCAADAGAECVKFQCHIIEDEMVPNDVIPGNADESIWNIMKRCSLNEQQDWQLKSYCESKGLLYLSTPFSRKAADRLERMDVRAYKIGSGECNNYPLIEHIARFRKPVILSTGMNDLESIDIAVSILRDANVPFCVMHCTSMYPTPYEKVRLGALGILKQRYPDAIIGLSDHSMGIYTCLAAVALGARIVEKHFTADKSWPGPDVPISIDPSDLEQLIVGSRAIFAASGGTKDILPEEQPTIDFAYACVVSIKDIKKGDELTTSNIWVKRPGTGELKAVHFEKVLGRTVSRDIAKNTQLRWDDLS